MPKNGAAGKAIKRLYLAAVRRIQMSELALDSASFSLPQREATFATCDLEESAHYVSIGSLHTLRPLKANPEVDLAVWRCSLQQTHLDIVALHERDDREHRAAARRFDPAEDIVLLGIREP